MTEENDLKKNNKVQEIEIQKVAQEPQKLADKNLESSVDKPKNEESQMNTVRTLTNEKDDKAQQQKEDILKRIDALEKELKSGGFCGKNCSWILFSLLAGMCMGTGSFIYASNFSEHGIAATGILAPAPVIMCLIIRL